MGNNILLWQSTHALCILAHLGMLIAGWIAFVFTSLEDVGNYGSTIVTLPWAASAVGAFGIFFNIILFAIWFQLDKSSLSRGLSHQNILPLGQGGPLHQSTQDRNYLNLGPRDETPETFYFRKKIAALFGTIFNLLLATADISLASKIGLVSRKNDGSDSSSLLNGVCAMAIITTVTIIATIVADIVKVLGDRAYQRDIDMRDIDDGDVDESDANERDFEYRDE